MCLLMLLLPACCTSHGLLLDEPLDLSMTHMQDISEPLTLEFFELLLQILQARS